jgi:digeranylgeranylglycerophospholipid reductase
MIDTYDVVVVGAGPTGSNAAYRIASKGYNVLLLERDAKPGQFNSCGGGVGYFIKDLYGYPDEIAGREISKVRLTLHNREIFFDAGKPIYTSVQRPMFDNWFAQRAANAGATLKVSHKALDYDPLKRRITCLNRVSGETVYFDGKLFIFADGPRTLAWRTCRVGLPANKPMHIGIAYELSAPKAAHDTYEFIFDEIKLPYGYFWVFPGENALNVGVGGPREQLRGKLGPMLHEFIESREDLRDLKTERISSGLIPAYLSGKMHGDGVMAIGDAAGFVNPLTGGGIFMGLKSSEAAAKTALESLDAGRSDAKFLSRYTHRMKFSKIYPSVKLLDFSVRQSQNFLRHTGKPLLSEIFYWYSKLMFQLLKVIKDF